MGENGRNAWRHKENYKLLRSDPLDTATVNILLFILPDVVCIWVHRVGMIYSSIYIAIII